MNVTWKNTINHPMFTTVELKVDKRPIDVRHIDPHKHDLDHITNARLPKFQAMPEMVIWGERFFRRRRVADDQSLVCYVEEFTYWIPPGMAAIESE